MWIIVKEMLEIIFYRFLDILLTSVPTVSVLSNITVLTQHFLQNTHTNIKIVWLPSKILHLSIDFKITSNNILIPNTGVVILFIIWKLSFKIRLVFIYSYNLIIGILTIILNLLRWKSDTHAIHALHPFSTTKQDKTNLEVWVWEVPELWLAKSCFLWR